MKITAIMIVLSIIMIGVFASLVVLIIRALLKYIKSKDVCKEKAVTRQSLGDALREHRTH